jgi:YbbR domain-containing protein
MNLLKGSFFLKLTAFVVAVLTYFYIQGEIRSKAPPAAVDPSYKLIKLTAKTLPVKVRFETEPPAGYRIVEDQIVVTPQQVTAIGPEAMLEEAVFAQTSVVDVSEYTKTITKQVPLESVSGIHLVGEPYMVIATVPIERIVQPEELIVEETPAPAPAEATSPTAAA